jgi:hypothetical protein
MKAQTIIAILVSCVLGLAIGADKDTAKVETAKTIPEAAIQGAWEFKTDDGVRHLKFIANGKWTVTQSDPKTGKVLFHHGGSYTFDGKIYVETVEFANENTAEMIGNKFKFEITLTNDAFHQKGIENPWTEDWTRVKK